MHKYINLSGQYGFGQDSATDYSSIQDILRDLDRLGIWQTVVEFPTMPNAIYQAQRLFEDLEKIPQWRQRIIPCFALGVSTQFQQGGMQKLRAILEKEVPFCVSLYPKNAKYRLRMMDIVLDQIEDLCSVVLIDRSQLTEAYASDDLVYLAQRYPHMHFVIRRVGYSSCAFTFDVMFRAKNICVDTSAMHTQKALELLCSQFGDDRVLFNTIPKSYGGASMAAITFADLPETSKNKIRYENFINMFRDAQSREFLTDNLKAIPSQIKNRFWRPFVEDGIAPDVEIYDSHCHLGPSGGNWYLVDCDFESQIAGTEELMKKLNVRKMVASVSGRPDLIQANCDMEEAVGDKKDKFLGYIRYSCHFDHEFTDEYLDERMRSGFYVGLKALPGYLGVDVRDPRYDIMFDYANRHHLPVLIHTWGGSDPGSPKKCAEVAMKWPNAKIIIGHTGGSVAGRRECEEIAQDPRYSNVYFEFCGSWGGGSWEETLKKIDYRRVLYGTDGCLHNMAWEMGRLLSVDTSDEALTAILGGNAKELFGF